MDCTAVKNAPAKFAWLATLLLVVGCERRGTPGLLGIDLSPPIGWRRVDRSDWMVPGRSLAAWSGPQGSSLVAYRTLPSPGSTAAMIADSLANRLENLPGFRIRERRTETVGGTTAAWVEVVAPGTGDALAPSGLGTPVSPPDRPLIPTRQVTLGFVQPDGTIYLRWHAPESSYDRIAADIRATLDSLRFPPSGGAWSSN